MNEKRNSILITPLTYIAWGIPNALPPSKIISPLIENHELPVIPDNAGPLTYFSRDGTIATPPYPGQELPFFCCVLHTSVIPPPPPPGYHYIDSSLMRPCSIDDRLHSYYFRLYHIEGTPSPDYWDSAAPSSANTSCNRWLPYDGGYGIPTPQSGGMMQLTNFQAEPVRKIIHHKTTENPKTELQFRISMNGLILNSAYLVKAAELDRITEKIKADFPECFVHPEARKIVPYLAMEIRQKIGQVPTLHIYQQPGWQRINERWVYVHDGSPHQSETLLFQSGFSILVDPGMTEVEACSSGMGILSLSQDLKASLIPFLFSHMALLWRVFDEADHPPRGILFISGTTGSLKTAVASLLFNFSGRRENDIPASFRDSAASFEQKMAKYADQVLLMDDFAPMATRGSVTEQKALLEKVTRYFGDGKGRSRSTGAFTARKTVQAAGLCAFTGEDTAGSESSMLRYILLQVNPDTYDKKLLAYYQRNLAAWTTHLSYFIEYVCANFEQLVFAVQTTFESYREKCRETLTAGRLVDSAVALMMTGKIFLDYACLTGCLSEADTASLLDIWSITILETLSASEKASRQETPALTYLRALMLANERGEILLAPSEKDYVADSSAYTGFTKDGYWYLQPETAYSLVQKFCAAQGKLFSLSMPKVHTALMEAGLIYSQNETRQGKTVHLPLRKISSKLPSGQRPRMLAINKEAMLKYLECNLS